MQECQAPPNIVEAQNVQCHTVGGGLSRPTGLAVAAMCSVGPSHHCDGLQWSSPLQWEGPTEPAAATAHPIGPFRGRNRPHLLPREKTTPECPLICDVCICWRKLQMGLGDTGSSNSLLCQTMAGRPGP